MLSPARSYTALMLAPFFLAAAALAAQSIPAGLVHDKDLVFAPPRAQAPALAMDVVRPSSGGPHPGVLLIHGGGFSGGKRDGMIPMAIALAKRGYVAASTSYRLTPKFQFPAQVHDVKAAVRFLRANAAKLSLDPDRIGAIGVSAGGTLSLFLGVTNGVARFEGPPMHAGFSSDVQCVVNLYGRSDMTTAYGGSRNAGDALPPLIGGDLPYLRKQHLEASPLWWVSPAAAPTISIHGTLDLNVPYAQSVTLHGRLIGAGVEARLETIEGAGHGFKGAGQEQADRAMHAFLDRHLKPAPDRFTVLISDHGPLGELVAMAWPSGRALWKTPNDKGLDVQSLPDGHVLFTRDPQGAVEEIDGTRKVVWKAGPEIGLKRPASAERLPNGNTLIADPATARIVEVSPKGQVVWQWEKPEYLNSWLRMCRRTAAGTTLAALQKGDVVLEIDAAGAVIWKHETPKGRLPYQARRLANGNTLIALADPGEVIEVDRGGKTVRSFAGKGPVRAGWIAGMAQLSNGGLMLADYTARRLVEVDAQGRMVHEIRDLPWNPASIAVDETGAHLRK